MTSRCTDCGQVTFWDDSVGSSVCTNCGTLADPSQIVLASHLESFDNGSREYPTWSTGNPTLKSIRNHNAWALSGQGKDVRDRQNTVCILPSTLFFDVSRSDIHTPSIPVRNPRIHPDFV
jgi:transcription factor IIIB 90 kDa subunit